ncbi:glycosyltransferase [Asticcacaulis excentricus]|uniref:Glycosyl transferase family 2 n=1 Tax=Asticcacaulis excentricus (strain ATCC 15261 / DSM 4724 / KCTC 12464 / NCIMB 9791 / VKM B-1370 / CB 48) TaxID=573065 RepID=E8RMQ4_ASTEC|nr:glycosyltransferase [Asticcacaulis excentricus]ADU13935.1 glycosyl transferase family 2 [Asticcacaulis excentricus CB 48]
MKTKQSKNSNVITKARIQSRSIDAMEIELKSQIYNLKVDISELIKRNSLLVKQIDSDLRKNAELKSLISELETSNQFYKKRYEDISSEFNPLQEMGESLKLRIYELEERYSRLTDTLIQERQECTTELLTDIKWTVILTLKVGPKKALSALLGVIALRASGQFDERYYKSQLNFSTRNSNLLWHYVVNGAENQLNPNSAFNTHVYLHNYPDVLRAGINPFVHYIQSGRFEGRSSAPLLDDAFISIQPLHAETRDAAQAVTQPSESTEVQTDASNEEPQLETLPQTALSEPLSNEASKGTLINDIHWSVRTAIKYGIKRAVDGYRSVQVIRRQGNFNQAFYAEQVGLRLRPKHHVWHYVIEGSRCGFDPSPNFSAEKYLTFYDDVKASGREPYAHYLKFGIRENRTIVPSQSPFAENHSIPQEKGVPCGLEDRPTFEWLYQKYGPSTAQGLGPYDIRPDDDVLIAAEVGTHFLTQFELLGEQPNFVDAAANLGEQIPNAKVVASDEETVDVSIVIPVYGQLPYTLNCIHSLLSHTSKYSFEIIVGDDASLDSTQDVLPTIPHIRYVRQEVNSGFIQNSNSAASYARGDWIVLLNNDVRVVDGWLDELIDSFEAFPRAGLIGSKLLYPDGSLQEAGGIIWQDGSAWNYGRNDDPNRPRYNHARQIDYASGCAIALPSRLWRELNGFDTHFIPAYCEDSDLAFRVRSAGYETWYQPLAKVIHYEGKTSGTDVTTSVKAFQVTNSRKLFERWSEELSAHRENGVEPEFERERNIQKRVLVVDATNPTPWADAGSVTTTLTIQIFQQLGYKVYFVPQDNFLYERRSVQALQRLGVECAYAPYEVNFTSYMAKYGHLFDIVQVFRFSVAEKCLNDIRTFAPQAKVIFNNMDLHFLRLQRQAELIGDPTGLAAADAVKTRELEVINAVDFTVVPSTLEARILNELLPDTPVEVFPYMTEFVGTDVPYANRKDIMFLGGFGHTPNQDAVEYFMEAIWPHLKRKLPEARYIIAGANPPDKIREYADDRVLVTGMIDDLGPWFDRCRVFAASIRFGAGVKGKVSTAMAHGLPVVATTCAAEGMSLVDHEHFILADDPIEFANAIVELYCDEDKWTNMSKQGQMFVKENNSKGMGVKLAHSIIERMQSR